VTAQTDRAAAVRAALRVLVAERGFHGAWMSAIAREAEVATGTAYTHYQPTYAPVLAGYVETKAHLAAAATIKTFEEDATAAGASARSGWASTATLPPIPSKPGSYCSSTTRPIALERTMLSAGTIRSSRRARPPIWSPN